MMLSAVDLYYILCLTYKDILQVMVQVSYSSTVYIWRTMWHVGKKRHVGVLWRNL